MSVGPAAPDTDEFSVSPGLEPAPQHAGGDTPDDAADDLPDIPATPNTPHDPAPLALLRDKPLPRRAWSRRTVDIVTIEDIVHEAVAHPADTPPAAPWRATGKLTHLHPPEQPFVVRAAREPVMLEHHVLGTVKGPTCVEAAPALPESRWLHADAPRSVRPGQRFAVSARLLCAAPGADGANAALRPFLVPESGRTVTIDLHVAGPLQVRSDATCRLVLQPGEHSDPVRFELEAGTPGPATLTLRAFAQPAHYLGQLQLALPVVEGVAGSHRGADGPRFEVGNAPQRHAILEIDVDPLRRQLAFRLRGPGEIGVQRSVTVSLAEAVADIAAGLQRKLDQIAQGNGLSARAVEALLQGTGADLWQRLLPPSVKALLLRNLAQLDALVIIGADDPIPWELLYPVGPGRPAAFLSDQILVSRWAFDARMPKTRVGAGAIRYVLPDAAPPAAHAEIAQLETLLGRGKRIATLDALLDEFRQADFGLLHFAAHHIVASDLPASAWLELDQPFQQGMLGADRLDAFEKAAPLVFMNACNSGAGAPLWTGSTGWAGRFLAAGAGAFVGSLWQVRDGPAKEFAASFYAALGAGQTLGEAFQAARRRVGQAGDPTRLGYTLFGNAAATLATRRMATDAPA